MPGLLTCFLLVATLAPAALATPPRAVVRGEAPPAGVTVLDRRGDRWLVSADAATLAALPEARLLPDAPAAPRVPARAFTPTPSPLLADLVATIDGQTMIDEVAWLAERGSRYSLSLNVNAVADALFARLAATGLATSRHSFVYGDQVVSNLVATQVGVAHPESLFVLCAHYDATSEIPYSSTPGADDNGTGVVGVLTAARLLADHPTDYTILYVLFVGEEQGLVGSNRWVTAQAAAGTPIVGALNLDMIGWWGEGLPRDLEIETDDTSRWLAEAVCWAADTYSDLDYELHVDNAAWWGDFASFWAHGYAAVNHEESWDWDDPDFNPNYHSIYDQPENLSPAFFAGGVKIAVAALATLAGLHSPAAVPGMGAGAAALEAGPNPFNGRVTLRLEAAAADGPQTVRVYDLRGRCQGEVAVPLRGGVGEAIWSARDADGRALSAGVYLARAEGLPGRPVCRVTYVP